MSCTASSTTMPSETSVAYSQNFPPLASPRQILNRTFIRKFPGRSRYPILCCYRTRSLHFLNHLFEILRHFRQRIEPHIHLSVFAAPDDGVHGREPCIIFGIIFAKLGTTTLLSFERRPRYCFGNSQQAF